MAATAPVSIRQKQIVTDYQSALDKHMGELKSGDAEKSYEIRDFADVLHIHPRHLSNTIHTVLGKSPCDLYEEKLIAIACELLRETDLPIGQIAERLFFDPSNFTKFFKHFTASTPKEYRQQFLKI